MACKKMKNFTFRGLMAPVFTPFDKTGTKINLNVIPAYVQHLKNLNVNGILINGTSGEGPSLSLSERKQLVETWCANRLPEQTIMVQVGGAPLPDVLDMARHAEKQGADALLCLPELYFKPTTCQKLTQYLSTVSAAAPETPLFYYHIPAFTNVNIDMAELLSSCDVPTLSGIKFTCSDLVAGSACIRAAANRHVVFLGADQIMSSACVLGFDSAIATTLNFAPGLSQKIFSHFKSNEIEKSQNAQLELTKLVETITKYGDWVTSMKMAMNLLSPVDVGPVRAPLVQPTEEKYLQLKNDIAKLGG